MPKLYIGTYVHVTTSELKSDAKTSEAGICNFYFFLAPSQNLHNSKKEIKNEKLWTKSSKTIPYYNDIAFHIVY